MKRILFVLILLAPFFSNVCPAKEASPADTLVWCGLDYSMVKMIGAADFRRPENIFPGMLLEWNGLFMKEMLPKLESMAKVVQTDLTSVESRNAKAKPDQIEREDGTADEKVKPTHITQTDLLNTVSSYNLKHTQGLGLVFVMDRLVKAQETGCLYVVFFDIPTRKIVYSERVCMPAGGAGFRNYWFRPVKGAVKQLPKMYKQAKPKALP